MKFDPTKPVQTRDGLPARILCTDRKSSTYPVVGLVCYDSDSEYIGIYTQEGKAMASGKDDSHDLVNVPVRHVHADVIIAWANGAEIEVWCYEHREWLPISKENAFAPMWNPVDKYRIKPE